VKLRLKFALLALRVSYANDVHTYVRDFLLNWFASGIKNLLFLGMAVTWCGWNPLRFVGKKCGFLGQFRV
jgi:hypothetical protein